MYPQQFFSLFPPFPRTSRVFVAMSFASSFDARWTNVLRTTIAEIVHIGVPLESFRVDLSNKNDAILIEVLDAISSSLLIVADITAIQQLDGRPVRNGNVMYEVGLAHAVRHPAEVILFRSDSYQLDFDVAGVRVHSYDPDGDPGTARAEIKSKMASALAMQEAMKRQSVEWATQRLTLPALSLLIGAVTSGPLVHPATRTMGEALNAIRDSQAISLLLELGCIHAAPLKLTPELLSNMGGDSPINLVTYVSTTFGRAVFDNFRREIGAGEPNIVRALERMRSKDSATKPV
jgi:hypothetical protein